MSSSHSTATNTLGVERRASFTPKPATPKRLSATDAGSLVEHTRVEDESVIEKKYSFGEVLGQGAFGIVKEVTNRLTNEKFAMKIVQKDKPGSNAIQLLEREVEVLKRVNHPSIIQLVEVYETSKKMYLIMELCKGGELSVRLRENTYFKEEEAKAIMRRLTEALVYMHDNDMVHRDLKLENVLLSTADPTEKFNIKVTDFGLAHMKGLPGCEDLMHSKCGTLYYMAPEVLNTRHEYTKMCDVWSLGVILYILLCGHVPFQSDNPAKLEEVIMQGELKFSEIEWINVSQSAKDLIKAMLCVDTSRRYTARKILDDPWFTGQAAPRTLNALELMQTLDFETSSVNTDSESHSTLTTVQEDDGPTPPPSCTSPNKKSSCHLPPPSNSPAKKKPSLRGKAHSSSGLNHMGSAGLKNSSGISINNGKLPVHSSGHTSHPSSGGAGTGRSRTLSVGNKPTYSSSSPRRPNSGHSHRERGHSTS